MFNNIIADCNDIVYIYSIYFLLIWVLYAPRKFHLINQRYDDVRDDLAEAQSILTRIWDQEMERGICIDSNVLRYTAIYNNEYYTHKKSVSELYSKGNKTHNMVLASMMKEQCNDRSDPQRL